MRENVAGCPFCDWTSEETFPDTWGGRADALWAGCEHALAEHREEIES